MRIIVPENVSLVSGILKKNGYEAFLAGGCVRDSVMGAVPHDYDIATNARPDETKKCFEGFRLIETGIKHGTVTVVSGGSNIEITTYRVDGCYKDHRRPESVSFADGIADDLSRRDFTVNAMAYSEKTGIVDLFGGCEDISRRVIRCVGVPSERFGEDALRIMRAVRFASVLGFSTDGETARAMHDMKELLENISAERIFSELKKMLCGVSAGDIIREFYDVIAAAVPGLSALYDSDIRSVTASRIEYADNIIEVRLALLLLSAGKNAAEDILRSLRSDNRTVKTVSRLTAYSDSVPSADRIAIKKLLSVLGEQELSLLISVMRSIALAGGDASGADTADEMRAETARIISSGMCFSAASLKFNGDDAAKLGFKGKQTGTIIKYLLDEVICERLPNEREALAAAALNKKQEI